MQLLQGILCFIGIKLWYNIKTAFSFKKMIFFTIFNKVHDLVKNKVDLT